MNIRAANVRLYTWWLLWDCNAILRCFSFILMSVIMAMMDFSLVLLSTVLRLQWNLTVDGLIVLHDLLTRHRTWNQLSWPVWIADHSVFSIQSSAPVLNFCCSWYLAVRVPGLLVASWLRFSILISHREVLVECGFHKLCNLTFQVHTIRSVLMQVWIL